ncbi:hypothetical protein ACFWPJ_31795, partial [Nocardia sp. NPDC058497]
AVQWAFIAESKSMENCAAMAGVDEAGVSWGNEYDARVDEVLRLAATLCEGLQNLGGVIMQAGFNYELADYYSTSNPAGAAPTMRSVPSPICRYFGQIPSAGGPSQGLRDAVDTAIKIADKLSIPIPDGDTDKLSTAASAWGRLQRDYMVRIGTVMGKAAVTMDAVVAADADIIRDKLNGMQSTVDDLLAACGELSTMCSDQKTELETLRKQTLKLFWKNSLLHCWPKLSSLRRRLG